MKTILTIALLLSGTAFAENVSFSKDIKPIFAKICTVCHNGSNPLPLVTLYPIAFRLRSTIKTRVSDNKGMPAYGVYISESDRALVKQWVLDGGKQ